METQGGSPRPAASESCKVGVVRRGYEGLVKAASCLQSPLLLVMRLYWGWQFFLTGKGKLMNPGKVTAFFASLHIPWPAFNAYLAGTTECVGGLLLVIGLASRLVCLPLIFVLIIAYVTAESEALKSFFSDPDKFLSATPFLFLMTCLVVLAFGPGKISADALLARFNSKAGDNRREKTAAKI